MLHITSLPGEALIHRLILCGCEIKRREKVAKIHLIGKKVSKNGKELSIERTITGDASIPGYLVERYLKSFGITDEQWEKACQGASVSSISAKTQ